MRTASITPRIHGGLLVRSESVEMVQYYQWNPAALKCRNNPQRLPRSTRNETRQRASLGRAHKEQRLARFLLQPGQPLSHTAVLPVRRRIGGAGRSRLGEGGDAAEEPGDVGADAVLDGALHH